MAQDRPPAPPFPRDEVDPKTTIGSAARPAAVCRVLRARAAGERHEGHVAQARGLRGGAEAARAALYKTRGVRAVRRPGVC